MVSPTQKRFRRVGLMLFKNSLSQVGGNSTNQFLEQFYGFVFDKPTEHLRPPNYYCFSKTEKQV